MGPDTTGEGQRDSLLADLPSRSRIQSCPQGIRFPALAQLCCKRPASPVLPRLPLHHSKLCDTIFFLQSASCRLSNCSVIYCQRLPRGGGVERKRKKKRKRKKIPPCYNLVLSVNQTFPVMLIACVSLMYFILLKSFETLQLSSYRPFCGYH